MSWIPCKSALLLERRENGTLLNITEASHIVCVCVEMTAAMGRALVRNAGSRLSSCQYLSLNALRPARFGCKLRPLASCVDTQADGARGTVHRHVQKGALGYITGSIDATADTGRLVRNAMR